MGAPPRPGGSAPRSTRASRRRAAAGAAATRRRVGGAVLAVVLVLAVVGLLLSVRGRPADRDASFVRTAPAPTGRPAAPISPTSTGAPPSSAPPSSTPPSSAAASSAAPTAGSAGAATPRPSTPARAPLTVLNNSTVTGLAAREAARLRARGWQVRTVGNLTGRIAATTVYYDAGHYAAAVQLVREMPGRQEVRPRPAGLPGSGLTIVLTDDAA